MARIPKRVSDRLSKQTRKFQKVLQIAKNRDINEADTVVVIADMLSDLIKTRTSHVNTRSGVHTAIWRLR